MAQPVKYALSYSFQNFQLVNPTTPLPADKVEIELNAVALTTDQIRANLALIQRDDGLLANGSVHAQALSTSVLTLTAGSWLPRGLWVTATAYAVRDVVESAGDLYVCSSSHTSGVFATDLAAGKWMLFSPVASLPTVSAFMATVLDDADAAAARTTLGITSANLTEASVAHVNVGDGFTTEYVSPDKLFDSIHQASAARGMAVRYL